MDENQHANFANNQLCKINSASISLALTNSVF